jgi:CRP-like cAMP-binding protein
MYLPRKTVAEFSKGQVIYDSQRPSIHLYVVMLGRVKLVSNSDDGCETVTGIVSVEGLFGESCLISGQVCNESAVTLDRVSLMAWPAAEVEHQIELQPRLGLALSQYLVRRSIELQNRIESMATNKTPARVMLALVQLADELGTALPNGATRITSLTHRTIAEFVGTSREIVTFEMNRLRRLGMLEYSRKHIDIYSQAMREALGRQGVGLPGALSGTFQTAS